MNGEDLSKFGLDQEVVINSSSRGIIPFPMELYRASQSSCSPLIERTYVLRSLDMRTCIHEGCFEAGTQHPDDPGIIRSPSPDVYILCVHLSSETSHVPSLIPGYMLFRRRLEDIIRSGTEWKERITRPPTKMSLGR